MTKRLYKNTLMVPIQVTLDMSCFLSRYIHIISTYPPVAIYIHDNNLS